jgi:hypothetical protein
MSDEKKQDGVEPTPASDGSAAGEPAAWGVLRAGGGWVSILANDAQAETSRKSFDKMENCVHEAVPLYRQPTLTDAEREAILTAIQLCEDITYGGAADQHAADVLRSLLERHK